jgi:hypothetical protein
MSVQQEVIPGLHTIVVNSMIIPPKRRRFSSPGGRVKEKNRGK